MVGKGVEKAVRVWLSSEEQSQYCICGKPDDLAGRADTNGDLREDEVMGRLQRLPCLGRHCHLLRDIPPPSPCLSCIALIHPHHTPTHPHTSLPPRAVELALLFPSRMISQPSWSHDLFISYICP